MTIYEVAVQHTIYVKAESETKACYEAERHVKEEVADNSFAQEVKSIEEVRTKWQDAIPYGDRSNDYTVAELLDNSTSAA